MMAPNGRALKSAHVMAHGDGEVLDDLAFTDVCAKLDLRHGILGAP